MKYSKYNKLIVIILIFTILMNFTFEYKSYSEAITITSGLYVFLKACYALGITYLAGQSITKLTKDGMKLYQEWQKFINNKPPEEKPPVDWEKTAILTLLGLQIGDTFKRIVDSVKGFFQEIGAKEGENEFLGLYTVVEKYDNQQNITKRYDGDFDKGFTVALSVAGYGMVYTQYPGGGYKCNFTGGEFEEKSGGGSSMVELTVKFNSDHVYLKYYNYVDQDVVRIPYESNVTPIEIPEEIEYTFEENSYQFTGNPDDIKLVSPNLSVLPENKITEENGKLIYNGTIDELVDDIINNVDSENLFDTNTKQLEEIEPGKIVIGESGTVPQPDPEPQPEPEPEPDPYEIPKDDISIDWSPLLKIDVTDKFPFSLPWDLKRIFEMFRAGREAPVWEFPIKGETIVIDFNNFEELARITRSFSVIIYVVILIILTRRFISGA